MTFPSPSRRRLIAALLGCVVCQSVTAEEAPAPKKVEIQSSRTQGTWEGWGCSLAWWAKIFGDRDDLADAFFTTKPVTLNNQTLPGLGMTIARYNAGACSWNEFDGRKMQVSKIIKPFRQIEGFWLDGKNPDPESASWNWSVDANQRAMLLKARDRGANRFELFSNSPMWWMCANDNPSGAKDGKKDNLRPDQHRNFAIYMATIAKQAKEKWGIAFTTIEPFNEPVTNYWFADCKQEGCHFDPKTQVKFLPVLREELDKRGLKDLPIAASDETSFDQAVATWNSYPAEVRKLVSQINVHGYQGRKGRRDLVHQAAKKDGKTLWNSEYGEKNADGLEMAYNLHLDFKHLRPTAWAYWQPLDHIGWGLIRTDGDLGTKVLHEANPKYFVLAQYSRHIRPGMKVIETGDLETIAAIDTQARRLVLVVLGGEQPGEKSFDLSKLPLANAKVTRWITEPKASVRYAMHEEAPLKSKTLQVKVPANSVQTFEIQAPAAP